MSAPPPAATADRFCIGCGKELPAGAAFCPVCGRASSAAPTPAGVRCPYCSATGPHEVRRTHTNNTAIVLVVLLVVAFPLFWIAFFVKEDVLYCASCRMKIGPAPRPPPQRPS